ncbi:hypothetical protein H6P81_008780 [Aristolochia fimbriata]|uniref:Elongin-A n=1 Tax=Aristolochia fimbriata TaxID=158543 RepID=A0AAV7EIY4_ARIFI|nr:hypothetical protein H6P81_008780 [Aristolochia fimbriata]
MGFTDLPTCETSPKKLIKMMKGSSLSSSKQNIETAIDSLRYMGDVGETDISILKEILPHCTAEQLMHIENSSKGRDLSTVTDTLWKKFYEQHFGEDSLNLVLREKMKQQTKGQLVFKWKQRDFSATKGGNLMKKARTEFLNSHELRTRKVMKRKTCMY